MPVQPSLHEMSLPAKLELFEALWEDLSRRPEQLDSPAWHGELLQERRARLARGEESLVDWEFAKQEIRRRVS